MTRKSHRIFYFSAIIAMVVIFQNCGARVVVSVDKDGGVTDLTTKNGPLSTVNLKRTDTTQAFNLDLTVSLHPVGPMAGANPQATLSGQITRHIGGPSGLDCQVQFNNEPLGDLIRQYSDGISFTHRSVICNIAVAQGQSVDVNAEYVKGHQESGAYVLAGSCAYASIANLPIPFVKVIADYLASRNSSGCIPANPLLALPVCPIVECAAPPPGCSYSGSGPVGSNGCPTSCGQLVCPVP